MRAVRKRQIQRAILGIDQAKREKGIEFMERVRTLFVDFKTFANFVANRDEGVRGLAEALIGEIEDFEKWWDEERKALTRKKTD